MKTVKEILEAYNDNYLSKMDPRFGAKYPPEKDIPNVINLRRKAIRVFPDGQKIALYYSPQLDRYVSIPYGPGTQASGIQINEVTYDKDVTPELADAWEELVKKKKKKIVSKADILSQLPKHKVGEFVRAGTIKGREAAGEVIKRYRPGSGLHTLGNLIGIGIQKLRSKPAAKPSPPRRPMVPEEIFHNKLKQIREAREYGKADAALDAASFLPGLAGSAASLASAGMSLSRGDYLGAALDTAGALPVVGYLAKGAKVAKGVKSGTKVAKAGKTAKKGSKTDKILAGVGGYGIGSQLGKSGDSTPDSPAEFSSSSYHYKPSKTRADLPQNLQTGRVYRLNEKTKVTDELATAIVDAVSKEKKAGGVMDSKAAMQKGVNKSGKPKTPKKGGGKGKGKGGAAAAGAAGAAAGYFASKFADPNSPDAYEFAKSAVPKPDSYAAFTEPGSYLKTPRYSGGQTSGQEYMQRQREMGIGWSPTTVQKLQREAIDVILEKKKAKAKRQGAYEYAKGVAKSVSRHEYPSFSNTKISISGGQSSGQNYLERQKELGMGYKSSTLKEQSNFDKLKVIMENNIKTDYITFGDNSIKINNSIAKKVINVYESLNNENKEKVKQIINEDISSFKKLINFAIRQ